MNVIGFDFGNYYSQVCCTLNPNSEDRKGGHILDLQDSYAVNSNGIPTAFFYSSRRNHGEPCYGSQAERSRPRSNIVRLMKRHLGETVTIEGRDFPYDYIITQTIQHCIREANRQLHAQTQSTTNLISLAYPVTYSSAQRLHLVRLAQAATLEDGTPLKVVGTIMEPAAAALDYLEELTTDKERFTVLAYDLGAGTFDVSLVEAYPNGIWDSHGNFRYYAALWADGISNLGGVDFDKIVYDMATQQMDSPPTGTQIDILMAEAEIAKRDLSTAPEAFVQTMSCDATITREDFNIRARPLVQRTIDMLRTALSNPILPKPDLILLTGGASQMPLVRQMIEEAFPEYRGRITLHRPSKAIAYGAARFGIQEPVDDIHISSQSKIMVQRTAYDIGIRFRKHGSDPNDCNAQNIVTMIPAGIEIPFESNAVIGLTWLDDMRTLNFVVCEATCKNPDPDQWQTDYKPIMNVVLQRDCYTPLGAKSSTQLILDKNNILHIQVRDLEDPQEKLLENHIELLNLST